MCKIKSVKRRLTNQSQWTNTRTIDRALKMVTERNGTEKGSRFSNLNFVFVLFLCRFMQLGTYSWSRNIFVAWRTNSKIQNQSWHTNTIRWIWKSGKPSSHPKIGINFTKCNFRHRTGSFQVQHFRSRKAAWHLTRSKFVKLSTTFVSTFTYFPLFYIKCAHKQRRK